MCTYFTQSTQTCRPNICDFPKIKKPTRGLTSRICWRCTSNAGCLATVAKQTSTSSKSNMYQQYAQAAQETCTSCVGCCAPKQTHELQKRKPVTKNRNALTQLANAILDARIVQGLTAANSKTCIGDCQMVA